MFVVVSEFCVCLDKREDRVGSDLLSECYVIAGPSGLNRDSNGRIDLILRLVVL